MAEPLNFFVRLGWFRVAKRLTFQILARLKVQPVSCKRILNVAGSYNFEH